MTCELEGGSVYPKQHSKWDEICSQNVNLCFLCRLLRPAASEHCFPSFAPLLLCLNSARSLTRPSRHFLKKPPRRRRRRSGNIFERGRPIRPSMRITAFYPMKVARQKNVSKHIKSVGETRRGRREKKRGTIRLENKATLQPFVKGCNDGIQPLFGDLNPRPRIC